MCDEQLAAVYMYRLVMIGIDLSETTQKQHPGNPRQNLVGDKIQSETNSENIFLKIIFFPIKFFFKESYFQAKFFFKENFLLVGAKNSLAKNFCWKKIFVRKKKFSEKNLLKTIFSGKTILRFCLGLNFVSDRVLCRITYRSCILYTII